MRLRARFGLRVHSAQGDAKEAKGRLMEERNSKIPEGMVVYAEGGAFEREAASVAQRLGVAVAQEAGDAKAASLALHVGERGISLVNNGMVMQGDWTRMLPRLKDRNLHKELLVKAAKIKGVSEPMRAVDATAGLGEDALLLAAAGFSVDLYESDPIIAVLLEDAHRRALEDARLASVAARMRVHAEDSVEALRTCALAGQYPDVVYLDPMFPAKTKKAATKKKFQVIHLIEPPCENQEALLSAALAAKPRKVVVKRPVKAPYLAGAKPSYAISGKTIRYDCIVVPR